jgi:hypothetical protein
MAVAVRACSALRASHASSVIDEFSFCHGVRCDR